MGKFSRPGLDSAPPLTVSEGRKMVHIAEHTKRVMQAGSRTRRACPGSAAARARSCSTGQFEAPARSGRARSGADKRRLSEAGPDAHGARFQFHFRQRWIRRRSAPYQWSSDCGLAERRVYGLVAGSTR